MIKILDTNFTRLGVLKYVDNAVAMENLNGEKTLDFDLYIGPKMRITDLNPVAPVPFIFNMKYSSPSFYSLITQPQQVRTMLSNNMVLQSISLLAEDSTLIDIGPNTIFEVDNDYYDVGFIQTSKSENGQIVANIEADHISYRLTQTDLEPYNEETGEGFEPMIDASPSSILSRILSGTEFTGTVNGSFPTFTFSIGSTTTRRQALMDLIYRIGGEVIFNKFSVIIVNHRGSTIAQPAIVGKNIINISKELDKRTRVEDKTKPPYILSYNCELLEHVDNIKYFLGDDIRILDYEMNVNSIQRINEISYDPNKDYGLRHIAVGEFSKRSLEEILEDSRGSNGDGNDIDRDELIDDIIDQIGDDLIDQIADNLIEGPEGPPGEPGNPGPQGPKGDDFEPTYRDRIESEFGSTSIETSEFGITIDGGSSTYTLNLTPMDSGDNQAVKKNGNSLQIGTLNQIRYIEPLSSATTSAVICNSGSLILQTGANQYSLNLIDEDGHAAEDGMVLAKTEDNQIAFTDFKKLFANANLVIGTELPPVADAELNTIYVVLES